MLFYALGLLVVLALCLIASVVAGLAAYFFVRKRHGWIRLVAVLAVVPLTFFWLAYRLLGTQEVTDPAELRAAWRTEFDSEPPPEVLNHRAGFFHAGDSGQNWQKFNAPQAVVEALVLKFIPTDQETFDRVSKNPNAPSWWSPEKEDGAAMTYHINTKWKPEPSLSEAVLAYNPVSRTVYFTYGFID
jgi:hypothetical protein